MENRHGDGISPEEKLIKPAPGVALSQTSPSEPNPNGGDSLTNEPDPIDSVGKITVTLDKMRAFISMTMPQFGGNPLTTEQIRALVAEARLSHGLRELTIAHLSSVPLFNRDVMIAEGTPPRKGKDGSLVYHVRLSKDAAPSERPDGSVDYKDLGIIENVEKDQVLCVKILPEPGVDGMNVLGDVVPAQAGKEVPLPVGKNTYISDDQMELRASLSGQCDFVDRRLNVMETFTVRGDVSVATGNISFIGNVLVSGNVLAGFSVHAGGNIDVNGCVEGASLKSGGNVVVRDGFHGMNKGEIIAAGSVRCKYIQAGRVQAGSLVESQVILSANVQSADIVRLAGARSTILGGRVIAKNMIECDSIGGRNNPVPTIVEVGCDPSLVTRAQEIQKELAATEKSIADIDRILILLKQLQDNNRLTQDKYDMMIRSVHTRRTTSEQFLALTQEAEEVKLKLASEGYGTIIARTAIYPGVRIVIGPESKLISSPVSAVMVVRGDDGLNMNSSAR